MDRSRKIDFLVVFAAIGCYLLSGLVLLRVAAMHTLSFTFCTEPGTANAQTSRCLAPQLWGYAFWLLVGTGAALTVAAVVRARRRRLAAQGPNNSFKVTPDGAPQLNR